MCENGTGFNKSLRIQFCYSEPSLCTKPLNRGVFVVGGQTLISSARLKRLSWRSLMYSDFTLLFQQAGPFSERFPVSTMIALQPNKKMLTMVTKTLKRWFQQRLCG